MSKRNNGILICFACIISLTSYSDNIEADEMRYSWPQITSQTKPWTRWWWPASAVDTSSISFMLKEYDKAGFGGMEITPIYGAHGYEDKFKEFLSPEWMELLQFTLLEAGRHGMGIDVANASGWPFGGPWVSPKYACRNLVYKVICLKGGETFDDFVQCRQTPLVRSIGPSASIEDLIYPIAANDGLQYHAFEQVRYPVSLPVKSVTAHSADGGFVDLTEKVGKDGKLVWTAPEGEWTVCELFLGWHGKLVERAGPGGEGDVMDHFSKKAVKNYLKEFDRAMKGYRLDGIRCFFNDSYEVDDAKGMSDWTDNLFTEFRKRRGYDLKPHIPELLGISGTENSRSQILYDYRLTISDLLLDKFTLVWREWASRHGISIRNQAHGAPGNILDLYAASDIPETEGQSIVGMKIASSAAHIEGKPLASAESCTWLNEHFKSTPGDVKEAVDKCFLAGINHVFYHGTCASPQDVPWPGWMFYAAVSFKPENSFWKDFSAINRYVARCQSFLQYGRPDNDFLLYFNAADMFRYGKENKGRLFHINHNTLEMTEYGECPTALFNNGYAWDFVSDRMIQNELKVRDGRIVTNSGMNYAGIVIPSCRKLDAATIAALRKLSAKGALVTYDASLPSGIHSEPMFEMGLQCVRRVKGDGNKYYFIKNIRDKAFCDWVPLNHKTAGAVLFNPMTGVSGRAAVCDGQVFLSLNPGETIVLETAAQTPDVEPYPFWSPEGRSLSLDGEWTVAFVDGGPVLPDSITVTRLGSWTEYGPDYACFSGSAEYHHTLDSLPDAAAYRIDLGEVQQSAAVYLDGEYITTLVNAPFAVDVPAYRIRNGSELKVVVSNSMSNRISWMDKNDIRWRVFYNVNVAARLSANRGNDGSFSARNWSVQPSGLLGPVTVSSLFLTLPGSVR